MNKLVLLLLFLFLPLITFSQKNLIEYCVFYDMSVKPFKELNITSYTKTWYELNKKGKFVRTDKVLCTFENKTGVLQNIFLDKRDHPFNDIKEYYKEDSLGNVDPVDEKGNCFDPGRVYEFDSTGRLQRLDNCSFLYNSRGKKVKEICENVSWITIYEFEYSGDTLKSEFSYDIYSLADTAKGDNYRKAGKLKEYVYEDGKLKGFRKFEKYFNAPKPPALHVFEVNQKTVRESIFIDNKLIMYFETKFGE